MPSAAVLLCGLLVAAILVWPAANLETAECWERDLAACRHARHAAVLAKALLGVGLAGLLTGTVMVLAGRLRASK